MKKRHNIKEIKTIGKFNIYDRVRIKGTNITGNIVNIDDEYECLVEYDAKYDKEDKVVYTHNVNELEEE